MNRALCLVPFVHLVALVAAGLAPTPARADDRPPECRVLGFSRTSPLCGDRKPCRLSDDLRSACVGADLAFTPTRGGGFVLHSPPVRTWPRRLVTLDRTGAALSAPFVSDGQAGRVHVAPDGRPEAWLYGRREGNGVTTRELVVTRVERGLPTVDRIPLG